MEYVVVVYPGGRTAYIDGEDSGQTNTVLKLDGGTHVFDLGDPRDYVPASRKITVQGTTVLKPKKVVFKASGA